jgi:hypothetical protein
MNFFYKLVKNHYECYRSDSPILLSVDGAGPYDKPAILPGCRDTAYNVVLRALAREPRPDDPSVSVEEGGDRDLYMREWIGIRDDQIAWAKLIMKIVDRIENEKFRAE